MNSPSVAAISDVRFRRSAARREEDPLTAESQNLMDSARQCASSLPKHEATTAYRNGVTPIARSPPEALGMRREATHLDCTGQAASATMLLTMPW